MANRRWTPPYVPHTLFLRLLRVADSCRDRAIIGVLALLGLRSGVEAAGLNVEDVDLRQRSLRLHRRKGGKEQWLPLEEPLLGLVREQVESLPYQRGPLFPSRKSTRLGYKGIYHLVKRLAVRAGEDPTRVWPHLARHAAATYIAVKRGEVLAQKLLGHASIQTTMGYVRLAPEATREAVADLWDLDE